MPSIRCSLLLSSTLLLTEAYAEAIRHQHGHDVPLHAHLHVPKARELSTLSRRDVSNDTLAVEIINNTPNDNICAYIITNYGDDVALITSESQYFSPAEAKQGIATITPEEANNGILLGPPGSIKRLNSLPIGLLSARIVASLGSLNVTRNAASLSMPEYLGNTSDAMTNWWFIEANLQANALYVNPTFVDFAGLPLDFDLITPSSMSKYTGLRDGGIGRVCQQLGEEQAKDGQPWSSLCMRDSDGANLRVMSPAHDDGFNDYWENYIDQVWEHYSTTSLTFVVNGDTKIQCCTDVTKNVMTCDGTSAEFAKPSTSDIWGCVGGTTFGHGDPRMHALGPAFCAAIHRGLLLVPGGEIQPSLRSDKYYPPNQTHNRYASVLHKQQFNHTGYAFPYDDVKATDDDDASGLLVGRDPTCLRIYVGGRDRDQLAGYHAFPSDGHSTSPSLSDSLFSGINRLPPTISSHSVVALSSAVRWPESQAAPEEFD